MDAADTIALCALAWDREPRRLGEIAKIVVQSKQEIHRLRICIRILIRFTILKFRG